MRLSKYLSLSVAMSRNQASFFIRKGRLSVDGSVITDPQFELADDSHVVFDGNPISIAAYQYIVLHKPAAYACASTSKTTEAEPPSVIELLKRQSEERYYHFANSLAPGHTGLVLFSDDVRWTNRLQRRLQKKQRVYQAQTNIGIDDHVLQRIQQAFRASSQDMVGVESDIQQTGSHTLMLSTQNMSSRKIIDVFASSDVGVDRLHLQQLGRLSLGDLGEGDYFALAEDEIKV